MSETRDPNELAGAAPDMAPLAWVIDEIRESLGLAADSIRRFVAQKSDLESLRTARNQVHQTHGALQLLDLRGVSLLTEAVEQLLQYWETHPDDSQSSSIKALETAMAAIVAYLEGLLSGRANQPIRLYPYYRDVLMLGQAPRVHPADLLFPDLSRRPAFDQIEVRPLTVDQLRVRRARFEDGLLGFLRDAENPQARKRMRDALADLEHLPQRGLTRSFWWVVRGLLDSLEAGKVNIDVDLKRVLARLNLQLRRLIDGGNSVAERLMIDVLYYVGRSDESVPRVTEVRQLYGLAGLIPVNFEHATLTAVDADALRTLKERLAQAKTVWGQMVAGAQADPAKLMNELAGAGTAATRLTAAPIAYVIEHIGKAAAAFPQLQETLRETLALEVASALLFSELGVDSLPSIDPEYAERARTVAARLNAAVQGQPLPDAGDWMSELSRRAQDRLTMGSVVLETQAALREIEQKLDRFFRNPEDRSGLAAADSAFDQIGGVLSVLGFEEPVAALRQAQQAVRRFADPTATPNAEEFARVAGNLGALGFFVESLTQDSDATRRMFHYDPVTGVFSADLARASAVDTGPSLEDEVVSSPLVAGSVGATGAAAGVRVESSAATSVEESTDQHLRLAEQLAQRLASAPDDASALIGLSRVMPLLANEAGLLDNSELQQKVVRATQLLATFAQERDVHLAQELAALFTRAAAPAVPEPTAPLPSNQAAADRELHEIFIEEAHEVLDLITGQLDELRATPDDAGVLTTTRRAFHTLKGSSRMVGLKVFGEGAWAVEQCFNLWLSEERPATAALVDLAATARQLMQEWIQAIAQDPHAVIDIDPLMRSAQRVREGGPFEYDGARPDAMLASDANLLPTAAPPSKTSGSAAEQAPHALPATPSGAPDLNQEAGTSEPISERVSEASTEEHVELAQAVDITQIADTVDIVDAAAFADLSETNQTIETSELALLDVEAPTTDELREDLRRIGPVEISHGLYSVFLNESDESIRTLAQDIAEWRFEPTRPASPNTLRRAHSLAGISGTVGLSPVHDIADPLDDVMEELGRHDGVHAPTLIAPQFDTLERAVEKMRGMLHEFAAGVYPKPAPLEAAAVRELLEVLRAQTRPLAMGAPISMVPTPKESAPARDIEVPVSAAKAEEKPAEDNQAPQPVTPTFVAPVESADDEASTVHDELDTELLEIFRTEANDLLPSIASHLRTLAAQPNEHEVARELMRQLHTLKGSARMAGAMQLGEVVHHMETRIEAAMQLADVPVVIIEALQGQHDQAVSLFDKLHRVAATPSAAGQAPAAEETTQGTTPAISETTPSTEQRAAGTARNDFAAAPNPNAPTPAQPASFIRVRSDVLDKLVDHAGEVSIARSKLETEVGTLKTSLIDLTENIARLRGQLREMEIQADAQIQARAGQLDKGSAAFDPLEYDRYTRLQELTRMLAESVEDVAMVQSNMLKGLSLADSDLGSQSRLTRELQQQLMRVRLVPFSNISERLYRVARQAAKELDKRVNLEITGASIEVDRGVLERMAGPFEHLVRNCIVHGLEQPAARVAAGKPEAGELTIAARQEGNEIIVQVADDGAGISLPRVRERAIERGLMRADQTVSDRELVEFIFAPGFSTVQEVTELAGRGVGMDVVRSELSGFGGRIAVSTEAGRGTRFTLYLPITLSIAQVVLVTVGTRRYALPAGMVEQVRRYKPMQLAPAVAQGSLFINPVGEVVLRPLAQLLGEESMAHATTRQTPVVLLRSGDDRLAIAVDEVASSQEVVVKNVGQQVSRLAGILGATILGNGEIVLIVNPVQLIARAPEPAAYYADATVPVGKGSGAEARAGAPAIASATVMVIDDSLTVRRVTQRLLERHGFKVLLAKDGVDALRQMQDTIPDIILVDIEMPRMDGYDLTRNVRSSAITRDIPIIMITSRTAEKHRAVAFDVGVNEYLGKPYQEDELLAHIRRYLALRAQQRLAMA